MPALKPGERKLQILQMLGVMLEHPKAEKITTAALAARLGVSEAALYRHFSSKAHMLEALIAYIEHTLMTALRLVEHNEPAGVSQVQKKLDVLLQFADRNPGLARVLIGEVLVHEDDRLQASVNRLIERFEASLRTSLRGMKDIPHDDEQALRAGIAMDWVLGRWHSFVKSGFVLRPTERSVHAVALLLRIEGTGQTN